MIGQIKMIKIPVNISIKYDPQIGLVLKDCLGDSLHCCLVLWIGNMIWKHTCFEKSF